ncbi:MAG: transcriptional regulator BetI [Tenericutes bacterium ADurb.Bin087]|nr:MAG: transcriptional regulator BetI [Tenericutes bacterium ADurb.Bin087]
MTKQTAPKTKNRAKTRRDDILEAGVRLFVRVPFTELTIAAVAREANCGHSLVYHYFTNINRLYEECANHVVARYKPFIDHLKSLTIPAELALAGSIALIVETLKKEKLSAYCLSMLLFTYKQAPRNKALLTIREDWSKLFLNFITEGQNNGRIINTLSAQEILNVLKAILRGLIGTQIISGPSPSNILTASEVYLPIMKGIN